MKFRYQGVEYRIEFQYDTKRTGKKVRNYTTCRIVTGDRENTKVVAEGTVVRYHYDRYDKETARKFALDEALCNLLGGMSQEFSRLAHIAYHRRPGGLDHERAVVKGLNVTLPVKETSDHIVFGATAGGVTPLGFNIEV